MVDFMVLWHYDIAMSRNWKPGTRAGDGAQVVGWGETRPVW